MERIRKIWVGSIGFHKMLKICLIDSIRSMILENLAFDFIIVGTGSGGATMAGRLAEICDWDVLSIEAGETPPLTSEVNNQTFPNELLFRTEIIHHKIKIKE